MITRLSRNVYCVKLFITNCKWVTKMSELEEELQNWTDEISHYSFPRWEELPDFDLYMDQVLTLTDNYLSVFNPNNQKKIITASMVNNYVKIRLIPPPIKKRYTKKHLAYMIAISVLKQVITISEIHESILYQASVSGIREAYDLFCAEQEYALKAVSSQIDKREKNLEFTKKTLLKKEDLNMSNLILRTATTAVATKIVTEKAIALISEERKKSDEKSEKPLEEK